LGREKYPKIFFPEKIQSEIRDDHTSLNKSGIPSFLVIDMDYPFFHTTQDTVDKCSKDSLQAVLDTTLRYLKSKE
jgi:hypothetical protein